MTQFPFIFSDERKYRIRRHVAFWVFWWLFQGVLYSFVSIATSEDYPTQLLISVLESFVFIIGHILLSYALMYFVLPRYLLKQKYLLTSIWITGLFLGTAVFSAVLGATVVLEIRAALSHDHVLIYLRSRTGPNFHLSILAGLRGGITICGIAVSIKLMKYWYIKEQRNLQLQKENAEAQLQLLKAQVHPHFLFNTLNNIYAHTQNTSPLASRLVMGLSEMLRFILYECNQPLVPLSKELQMIKDYIDLEMIRYDAKNLDVHIDLPTDTKHLSIAPLLLLPFVENCFKHGTSNMIDQPWFNLRLYLTDSNRMYLKLMNGKAVNEQPNRSSGIGIHNVRQRLELLYPAKHELVITDELDVFIVNLWVQLEEMPVTNKKETGTFMLSYYE